MVSSSRGPGQKLYPVLELGLELNETQLGGTSPYTQYTRDIHYSSVVRTLRCDFTPPGDFGGDAHRGTR